MQIHRFSRTNIVAFLGAFALCGATLSASAQQPQFMVGTWHEHETITAQGRTVTLDATSRYNSDGTMSGSGTISEGSSTENTSMQGTWSAQISGNRIDLRTTCASGDCGGMTSNGSIMTIIDQNTVQNPAMPAQVLHRQ